MERIPVCLARVDFEIKLFRAAIFTRMLLELLKQATPDYLVGGIDLFSFSLSNKTTTTTITTAVRWE